MKKFINLLSIVLKSVTEGRAQAAIASKKHFGAHYH